MLQVIKQGDDMSGLNLGKTTESLTRSRQEFRGPSWHVLVTDWRRRRGITRRSQGTCIPTMILITILLGFSLFLSVRINNAINEQNNRYYLTRGHIKKVMVHINFQALDPIVGNSLFKGC